MKTKLALGIIFIMMATMLTSCAAFSDGAAQHDRCYANRTSNH